MLEMENIQYKGFRNIVKDGETEGFQVGIRFVSYRGPWLSQFRFKHVKIDDEVFGPDVCTFILNGIEYTYEEMLTDWRQKWHLQDVCYIRVKKPGGLASGNHKVNVIYWEIASYLPPRLDTMKESMDEDPSTAREMIIV